MGLIRTSLTTLLSGSPFRLTDVVPFAIAGRWRGVLLAPALPIRPGAPAPVRPRGPPADGVAWAYAVRRAEACPLTGAAPTAA